MPKKIIDNQENDSVRVTEVIDEVLITEVGSKENFFKKLGYKKIILIILVLTAVMGVLGSIYYYNKYTALKTNANIEAEKETQRLVSVLGKLMELPEGEIPTVATISDKEKLADQTFFNKAENGDILFAYTTAMKAILYRPSTNKIINVAPISINQNQDLTPATKKVDATSTKK